MHAVIVKLKKSNCDPKLSVRTFSAKIVTVSNKNLAALLTKNTVALVLIRKNRKKQLSNSRNSLAPNQTRLRLPSVARGKTSGRFRKNIFKPTLAGSIISAY